MLSKQSSNSSNWFRSKLPSRAEPVVTCTGSKIDLRHKRPVIEEVNLFCMFMTQTTMHNDKACTVCWLQGTGKTGWYTLYPTEAAMWLCTAQKHTLTHTDTHTSYGKSHLPGSTQSSVFKITHRPWWMSVLSLRAGGDRSHVAAKMVIASQRKLTVAGWGGLCWPAHPPQPPSVGPVRCQGSRYEGIERRMRPLQECRLRYQGGLREEVYWVYTHASFWE